MSALCGLRTHPAWRHPSKEGMAYVACGVEVVEGWCERRLRSPPWRGGFAEPEARQRRGG